MNGQTTMKSLLAHGCAVLILQFALTGVSTAQEGAVGITLQDAIRMAAEKNLDVRVERYNPAQAEADIRRNWSIYDYTLAAQSSYG